MKLLCSEARYSFVRVDGILMREVKAPGYPAALKPATMKQFFNAARRTRRFVNSVRGF